MSHFLTIPPNPRRGSHLEVLRNSSVCMEIKNESIYFKKYEPFNLFLMAPPSGVGGKTFIKKLNFQFLFVKYFLSVRKLLLFAKSVGLTPFIE